MDITNIELKEKLGNIAILEGDFSIDQLGFLFEVEKELKDNIKLKLFNIYRDHSLLLQLPKYKIDTLLMETTFTYEDKIYDIAKFLLELYTKTGWKPKKVVNTMDYGLEAFYIICYKLEIEVYRLDDANDIGNYDFQLKQIKLNDLNTFIYEDKYIDFKNLLKEYGF